MRRREFIAGLGIAAAWPVAVRAQQPPTPVIGLLQIGAPSSLDFTGFRQGLKDMGYVEGQNLAIDVRWANDDPDRLPGLAADLVHRQVRVLATIGSALAVNAPKLRPRRFRSFSVMEAIRFNKAWSPASIGRAATSLE
jgi:putative tryptophan/tyrosine transport system substrate-binding protein